MRCNTPDVTFHICNSNSCHFRLCAMIFPLWLGFLSFVLHFVHVMHLISCHLVHLICIRVRLMHPSIFPVVHFAFRRSYLLRWSFLPSFRVWGLNISGLDRYLPSGLGLLPVDRLSSFVPCGLRLMLQWLTEGPRRPRVCCSPTPFQFGRNPPKTLPSSRAFDHDRVAANRAQFGAS